MLPRRLVSLGGATDEAATQPFGRTLEPLRRMLADVEQLLYRLASSGEPPRASRPLYRGQLTFTTTPMSRSSQQGTPKCAPNLVEFARELLCQWPQYGRSRWNAKFSRNQQEASRLNFIELGRKLCGRMSSRPCSSNERVKFSLPVDSDPHDSTRPPRTPPCSCHTIRTCSGRPVECQRTPLTSTRAHIMIPANGITSV